MMSTTEEFVARFLSKSLKKSPLESIGHIIPAAKIVIMAIKPLEHSVWASPGHCKTGPHKV